MSSTAQRETRPLTDEEIQAYLRDGILVPRFRLPATGLHHLQILTKNLASDNPGLLQTPYVSPHVPQAVRTDPAAWMQIARHPQILDLVEQLLGPDLILWSAVMFYKDAGRAPLTPYHQDGPAFPIRPLESVLLWIAVFDSVIENGALRVIPGSHASRKLYDKHEYEDGGSFTAGQLAIRESLFDASKARAIELQAGEMAVFSPYLIHGAGPNLGTRVRAGYAVRFMPSTSVYDREWAAREPERFAPAASTRPIFLVRGVDRSGVNQLSSEG
jgi:ectoine hydroxylase-related dioxygenase (phytanoyl-CoA dioxygenase family)